ncbi:MAG: quinolinate synthase NadA [Lachnospiraceae bacterium]|nr:quinolinate synthase NadA [Lachnospiraceae bacterium]
MNVATLQEEVLRLKKEKDVCILAHSYVAREIAEVADFVGDSFQLSVKAQHCPQKTVIMCGVRFMAETVKILSPEKTVILSAPDAGCPMAEQLSVEIVEQARKMFPGCAVVAYINTTAELKTVCDVCVTSSSAVKIVKNMPQDKILFIPDQNLGQYVKAQVPDKDIRYMQGGCPVHAAMTREDVLAAKAAHPNALFLVHPECVPAVVELADFVGSTAAIMDFAKKSDAEEFIIGTENSIMEHLQYDCPGKMFYPLSKRLICMNMKLTTLGDVANILRDGRGGEEIVLPADVIEAARRPIDAMLAFG